MPTATFFLSTGRCGTQWLARHLGRVAGEGWRIEHEPLQWEYEPRRMLAPRAEASSEARAHVADISRTLETQSYVECGHPCWSSLPWIAERLAGRMQIVHLVREPVATAASWISRGAFIPPLLPHVPERVLISPFDEGVSFPQYRDRWAGMLPFEKALLYWAEVNAVALRLEQAFAGSWLRLRYEDLFHGEGADELLQFLGLPPSAVLQEARSEREDAYRFVAESPCDPRLLGSHPKIADLARRLGYRPRGAG